MPRSLVPQQLGALRERVTVQEFQTTGVGPDATQQWVDLFVRLPAEVQPMSAVERLQAQALGSQVGYTVRIRHRIGVKAAQRLTWHADGGDRPLEIRAVTDPDGRKVHLRLECSELA
jgi:SPP1 family predicted phage head-tail adaptor